VLTDSTLVLASEPERVPFIGICKPKKSLGVEMKFPNDKRVLISETSHL
jgi:hypothetical protein